MKLTNTSKVLVAIAMLLAIVLVVALLSNNESSENDNGEENYSSEYEVDNDRDSDELVNEDNSEEVDLDDLREFEADVDIHNGLEPIVISSDSNLASSLSYTEFKEEISDHNDLISFLDNNFEYLESDSLVAKSPEAFFEAKSGSAVDFAVFSFAILDSSNYITGIMRYDYSDSNGETRTNFVTVVRTEEGPRQIVFNEQGVFLFEYGWSFQSLINTEEERLGVDIDKYLYFVDLKHDLSEPGSMDWVINK